VVAALLLNRPKQELRLGRPLASTIKRAYVPGALTVIEVLVSEVVMTFV